MSDHVIQCPICKSVDSRCDDHTMHIYVCTQCGHYFTLPGMHPAEEYSDAYYFEQHKNWFENPDFPLFTRILHYADTFVQHPSYSLLDVGCGKGDFLKFAASKNPKIRLSGIDLADNVQIPGIIIHKGDFLTFPFTDKFDVIVNTEVIEHVEDVYAYINGISSLLRDDGILITVTINNNSLLYRTARLLKMFGIRSPYERLYHHHHVQHYTQQTLTRAFAQSGFKILDHHTHNFPMKAVDVPTTSALMKFIFLTAVFCIFTTSNFLNMGQLQTIVCKRLP